MLKKTKVFIDCEELNSFIKNTKKIRIFDSSIPTHKAFPRFLKERIDGADFLSLEDLSDKTNKTLSFPFPRKEDFLENLKKYQIDLSSTIVFYDQYGIYSSPRAWFIFKFFNFENIFILNGGLPIWKQNKYAIVTGDYEMNKNSDWVAPTIEEIQLNKEMLTNFEEVNDFVTKNPSTVLIIDTRPYFSYFTSQIPTSINIPYSSFLNKDQTIKNKEELKKIIDLNTNKTIISSCGIGMSACTGYIILKEILNYSKVKLYDGSIEEYQKRKHFF